MSDLVERLLNEPVSTGLCNDAAAEIQRLQEKPISIKVEANGQVWITFDAGEGRQAMLNLNNIVLAKPAKGINRGIMLDTLRRVKPI